MRELIDKLDKEFTNIKRNIIVHAIQKSSGDEELAREYLSSN